MAVNTCCSQSLLNTRRYVLGWDALMGLISDILTQTLIESSLDETSTMETIRSFQKLLWIQNDFINRHYVEANSSVP